MELNLSANKPALIATAEESSYSASREDPVRANAGKVPLEPMRPLVASSVVVNLLLATGPFSYPYAYAELGPIFSCLIMTITCYLSYVTATYIVEAVSVATTV